MSQWKNQLAVISGAGSGIGMGLAIHAMKLGMNVVATDVDTEGLSVLEQAAKDTSGALIIKEVDVRHDQQVEQLAKAVFDEFECVNLLFNNAGVLVDGKSWERSLEDWRWSFDVNVMGVIHGIRSFLPRMMKQKSDGVVINTSSTGGLLGGSAFMGPYQGTKHMVTAITESLYQELLIENTHIRAALLCPGEVDTGIWKSDRLRSSTPTNQFSSKEEKEFHDIVSGRVADGLDPMYFAQLVFQQIESGCFWLFPQPEFFELLKYRNKSILNQTNPVPLSVTMTI